MREPLVIFLVLFGAIFVGVPVPIAVIPSLLAHLACVVALAAVPEIALLLPDAVYGSGS